MFSAVEILVTRLSRYAGLLAGAAVVAMMLLTCADITFRLFSEPIPGTYELVGFLGALTVSFALAATSLDKGHIAVELLVDRFPQRLQMAMDGLVGLVGTSLFAVMTWRSWIYALDLKESGEVSLTLALPIYPIAFGMAVGCGLVTLVLLLGTIRSLRRTLS